MILRNYIDCDCDEISKLFYDTVHTVNACDYSAEQLNAWANNAGCLKSRRNDLANQRTLVAEINSIIVGFGSIDKTGYLDLLFVHNKFQRKGIATALCNELEKGFPFIKTHASITSKPFFENRGYIVIKENNVERMGVKLKNFEMHKVNLNN